MPTGTRVAQRRPVVLVEMLVLSWTARLPRRDAEARHQSSIHCPQNLSSRSIPDQLHTRPGGPGPAERPLEGRTAPALTGRLCHCGGWSKGNRPRVHPFVHKCLGRSTGPIGHAHPVPTLTIMAVSGPTWAFAVYQNAFRGISKRYAHLVPTQAITSVPAAKTL